VFEKHANVSILFTHIWEFDDHTQILSGMRLRLLHALRSSRCSSVVFSLATQLH